MAVAATASYDGGDDAFPFGVDELCGAMHAAFVSADHEFLRHSANAAGTTAVVAVRAPQKTQLEPVEAEPFSDRSKGVCGFGVGMWLWMSASMAM